MSDEDTSSASSDLSGDEELISSISVIKPYQFEPEISSSDEGEQATATNSPPSPPSNATHGLGRLLFIVVCLASFFMMAYNLRERVPRDYAALHEGQEIDDERDEFHDSLPYQPPPALPASFQDQVSSTPFIEDKEHCRCPSRRGGSTKLPRLQT
ncbi:hypothetical protein OS493_039109 [Desmophyllum pertusum]|uniref:Uncharacterized protein n=1 Tax=Desmophyllum pertusum TaxID=174260 RepID=A0A9W9ZHS1_9CNID|nr:hypothetical protein OS493_039109 [Desmophyllum pertusum]